MVYWIIDVLYICLKFQNSGGLYLKYCFGTFLKLLCICSPKKTTQKKLCGTMFLMIDDTYDICDDDPTVSKLKACKDDVSPLITDKITTTDVNQTIQFFEDKIIPLLKPDSYSNIIATLLYILESDSIDDSTEIGKITAITKNEYIEKNSFVFSEILVDFFLFSLTGIANKDGKQTIDEKDDNFIENASNKFANITVLPNSKM